MPGESYLDVLDGLYESPIRLISCRHESSAANMAEAYGKLTGRPGVCLVTRGPGATQASVGVHTAFQDSTPLLLLVGQVASDQEEREAFQEVDYRRMFGPLAKWVAQIDRTDRIPEYVARAYATACSGRPGPVVLALPEDMLARESDAADARPFTAARAHPGAADIEALRGLLERAERPLAVIGGAGWTAAASDDLRPFLEATRSRPGAAFRRQDALDNDSPSYVGDVGIGINPTLAARVKEADLLLAIGPAARRDDHLRLHAARAADAAPDARARPPGARGARPRLPRGAPRPRRARRVRRRRARPAGRAALARVGRRGAADYEAWQVPGPLPGDLDLGACIAHLRERLPDATVTNGAGNFTVWVHRFWRWHRHGTQLAPTSGAMGYGVPAAVAAKAVDPERTVDLLRGDGDFLMSGQELATAMQYDLPVLIVVGRQRHARHDPDAPGAPLPRPRRRHRPPQPRLRRLRPLVRRLRRERRADGRFRARARPRARSGNGAVVALRLDPEAITPRTTLSAIRTGS